MRIVKQYTAILLTLSLVLLELSPAISVRAMETDEIKKGDTDITISEDVSTDNTDIVQTSPKMEWGAIDWTGEITLLDDWQEQQQLIDNRAEDGTFTYPTLHSYAMTDDAVLEYFDAPYKVRRAVEQYRQEITLEPSDQANAFDRLERYLQAEFGRPVLTDQKEDTWTIDENAVMEMTDIKTLDPKDLRIAKNAHKAAIEVLEIQKKSKINDNPIAAVTLQGLVEKAERQPRSQTIELLQSFKTSAINRFRSWFTIPSAQANFNPPLINYYDGIDEAPVDNALYYLSKQQADEGAFGDMSQYELTAAMLFMLSDFAMTENEQYDTALAYLMNTEPKNNREKAIKARILAAQDMPHRELIDEIVADQLQLGGGIGLGDGYETDILTTLEAHLAMFAVDYWPNNALAGTMLYIWNSIPNNGELKYTGGSNASYYLINKTLQNLVPFQGWVIDNGEGPRPMRDKVNALFAYLDQQYDEDEANFIDSNDLVDAAMYLRTLQLYNAYPERQAALKARLVEEQRFTGSFDDSVFAGIAAAQGLADADIIVENFRILGNPVNGEAVQVELTIRNIGQIAADAGIIRLFVDDYNPNLTIDMAQQGLVLGPNERAVIPFNINNTDSYIGNIRFATFVEIPNDLDYDNNWGFAEGVFAPSNDGTPALPLYASIFKFDLRGLPAIIATIPENIKADPHRSGFVVMYREEDQAQWQFAGYNPDRYIMAGPFQEGRVYELMVGVVHQDGQTVTHPGNPIRVRMSAVEEHFLGSISGQVTLDYSPVEGFSVFGQSSISARSDINGQYWVEDVLNGAVWLGVREDPYENFKNIVRVREDQVTENVRLFTHLKEDNEVPVIDLFQLRWLNRDIARNQNEYQILIVGDDNVAVEEARVEYWDPEEAVWIHLNTVPVDGDDAFFDWFIPAELQGEGYRLRATFVDYRGNESEPAEFGPFEIIDGTPPSFRITSPNGGEEIPLGSQKKIGWRSESVNPIDQVSLWIEYPNGSDDIDNVVNRDGFNSMIWDVPSRSYNAGDRVKIRVNGEDPVNFGEGEDLSDNFFRIVDQSPDPMLPWVRPDLVSDLDAHSIEDCRISKSTLKTDAQGTVHLWYYCSQDTFGQNRTIVDQFYHRSKAIGQPWSPLNLIYEQTTETNGNLDGYSGFNGLDFVMDNANQVHAFWIQRSGGGCINFNDEEIMSMQYDGRDWSQIRNLSNNNTESRLMHVTTNRNGQVELLWRDGVTWGEDCSTEGERRLQYAQVNNQGGLAFNQALQWEHSPSYPRLVYTPQAVHMIYRAANNVWHRTYNGVWSNAVSIHDGVDMEYPSVVAGEGNTVHLTYQEYFQEGRYRRLWYQQFDGQAWQGPIFLTEGIEVNTERPFMHIDSDGEPHVLFQYYDRGENVKRVMWMHREEGEWQAPIEIDLESHYVQDSTIRVVGQGDTIIATWENSYAQARQVFWNSADLSLDLRIPGPVNNLRLESTQEDVILRWDAYEDVDGDFEEYRLYRTSDPASGDIEEIAGLRAIGQTRYTDSGIIDPEAEYYYAIRVVDEAGNEAEAFDWVGSIRLQIPDLVLGDNLIDDADMEQANEDAWYAVDHIHSLKKANFESTNGVQSMYTAAKETFAGFGQQVYPIHPEQMYRLSFFYKLREGTGMLQVKNDGDDIILTEHFPAHGNEWRYYETYLTGDETELWNLHILLQDGTMFVDNVSFIPVSLLALNDGDMDAMDMDAWPALGSFDEREKIIQNEEDQMLRLRVAPGTSASIYQQVPALEPGQRYRLRIAYSLDAGIMYPDFVADVESQRFDEWLPMEEPLRYLGYDDWYYEQRIFEMPADEEQVMHLRLYFKEVDMALDDVIIERVIE